MTWLFLTILLISLISYNRQLGDHFSVKDLGILQIFSWCWSSSYAHSFNPISEKNTSHIYLSGWTWLVLIHYQHKCFHLVLFLYPTSTSQYLRRRSPLYRYAFSDADWTWYKIIEVLQVPTSFSLVITRKWRPIACSSIEAD